MSTWFRAGMFAALFVFATTPSPAAEKTFQDEALNDAAITLEADLKDEAGTVEKPLLKLKQEADALHQEPRPRRRRRHLCADRHGRAERRQGLAPARRSLAAHSRHARRMTARRASSGRGPPPISPISARPRQTDESASLVTLANAFAKREEWRQALNALKLALALHEHARASGAIHGAAREIRLPRFQFQRRFRRRVAARLLPVQRDLAEAHRLLAVRLGRGPGQAGALGRRAANLRRGAEARRELRHHAARRACPRRSAKTCSRTPSSISMCATGARRSGSRARPMCCRAPASRASRSSPSTPTSSR